MRINGSFASDFLLILLLSVAVSFSCGGSQPRNVMLDETSNNPNSPSGGDKNTGDLEKFIFSPDRFTNEVVPRRLDPARVAKFMVDRISDKDALKVFIQAEKVAAFYDTYEIAPKFRGFLTGNESGEDAVLRSIVITRTIARVGKAEDIEFASRYYAALIPKVDSSAEFTAMILLHDALNLGAGSGPLRQRLNAKMTTLEARRSTDDQARLQYLDLEEKVASKLTWAEKASLAKERILKMTDRKQRIDEEIKAYSAIEYGYVEFLEPWAASRLRKETWAAQPEMQTTRPDNPSNTEDVVKALHAFIGKLGNFSTLDDEERESVKVRLLRAIKFFGGKVSEEEQSLLTQYKGTQADTLANEGFMLD